MDRATRARCEQYLLAMQQADDPQARMVDRAGAALTAYQLRTHLNATFGRLLGPVGMAELCEQLLKEPQETTVGRG